MKLKSINILYPIIGFVIHNSYRIVCRYVCTSSKKRISFHL